jgi:hypothetical protein
VGQRAIKDMHILWIVYFYCAFYFKYAYLVHYGDTRNSQIVVARLSAP